MGLRVMTSSIGFLPQAQTGKSGGQVHRFAPAAIVSAYRTACWMPEFAQIDMSIAMENLWLETDAQGLGGVWLGIAPMEDRMEVVEKIIGMPDTLRAFAIFPFGYPAEERKQQDRFDPERIHYVE